MEQGHGEDKKLTLTALHSSGMSLMGIPFPGGNSQTAAL